MPSKRADAWRGELAGPLARAGQILPVVHGLSVLVHVETRSMALLKPSANRVADLSEYDEAFLVGAGRHRRVQKRPTGLPSGVQAAKRESALLRSRSRERSPSNRSTTVGFSQK